MYPRLILSGIFFFLTVGCSSLGKLTPSQTLAMDAVDMPTGDLAGLGPQHVISTRMTIEHQGEQLSVALYQPAHAPLNSPAIVFLPGLMASDDQYESYARALASRGFVVAVRGWYSLFTTDIELAHDANVVEITERQKSASVSPAGCIRCVGRVLTGQVCCSSVRLPGW
jgi:hypothetical protein